MDWDIPSTVIQRIGLNLQQPVTPHPVEETRKGELIETPPPPSPNRQGTNTPTFRSRRNPDYSIQDSRNRQLGLAGELLVLNYEKQQLINIGRSDLADMVRQVSVLEGDAAGYDIESFTQDGQSKYIEVKTTKGVAETPFYMTKNEIAFCQSHYDEYQLYRVYKYEPAISSGNFFIIKGDIEKAFEFTPTQYILRLKKIER
jgi:hypothetical protein